MSMLVSESLGQANLASSHAFCRRLTRSQARNFYYGLKLLPQPKRSAMFTLYAYMRLVDDIADDQDGRSVRQRIDELESWREQTHLILAGREASGGHLLWPAFGEMVQQYRLPPHVFDDVIAGQRQDLEPEPFETFEQLRQYCYRVAGVVGLASIYIWGFEGGAETEALAAAYNDNGQDLSPELDGRFAQLADQRIKAPVAFVQRRAEPVDGGVVADVERGERGRAAGGTHRVVELLKSADGARQSDHMRARACQRDRSRVANAARRAGDERDAVDKR